MKLKLLRSQDAADMESDVEFDKTDENKESNK